MDEYIHIIKEIRFLMLHKDSYFLRKKDIIAIEKFGSNTIRNMLRDDIPQHIIMEVILFLNTFEEKYEFQCLYNPKWYHHFKIYDTISNVYYESHLGISDCIVHVMRMSERVRKKVIKFKKVAP